MIVKFQGGPFHGKRQPVQDGQYEVIVQAPKSPRSTYAYDDDGGPTEIEYVLGSYMRRNDTLKNGTQIFQWMGWGR